MSVRNRDLQQLPTHVGPLACIAAAADWAWRLAGTSLPRRCGSTLRRHSRGWQKGTLWLHLHQAPQGTRPSSDDEPSLVSYSVAGCRLRSFGCVRRIQACSFRRCAHYCYAALLLHQPECILLISFGWDPPRCCCTVMQQIGRTHVPMLACCSLARCTYAYPARQRCMKRPVLHVGRRDSAAAAHASWDVQHCMQLDKAPGARWSGVSNQPATHATGRAIRCV